MPQAQVISYPTPYLNNNIPIDSDFYIPSRFVIEDITIGQTTTVQTTVDHNYVIGQQIRIFIPEGYGCVQLNGKTGYVISIPNDDEVVVNIDSSRNVNQFIAADLDNSPAITAIGDINSGIQSSTGVVIPSTAIPGSFINIS